MSTSSQPEDYSITLNDTMSDTITLTSSGIDSLNWNAGSTVTVGSNSYTYQCISGGGASTYSISGLSTTPIHTISSIGISDYKINLPVEWVDCFPDFGRIEKMCAEYPGLKIAYDQFKTVYALVREDYDTPKDQRVKP